jgi:hypothetical protein
MDLYMHVLAGPVSHHTCLLHGAAPVMIDELMLEHRPVFLYCGENIDVAYHYTIFKMKIYSHSTILLPTSACMLRHNRALVQAGKCRVDIRRGELEARLLQLLGQYSLTTKKHFFPHLPKYDVANGLGNGENGRAIESRSETRREFRICAGLRTARVHHPLQLGRVLQGEGDDPNSI